MTEVIRKVPGTTYGAQNVDIMSAYVWNQLVDEMTKNNTVMPDIKRIIYNVGTKKYPIHDEKGKAVKDENGKVKTETRKVLTTVVFFADNTKVSVTNSEHDGVQFEDAVKEEVKIDDTGKKYTVKTPRGFQIATHASKEAGLVYAICKRRFGIPDENGTIQGDGFGRKLNDFVNNAYDSQLEAHIAKEAKAAAKAEYEARKNTAKPKAKRYSLGEAAEKLAAAADRLGK